MSAQAISTTKQKKRRHIFIKLLYGMLVLLVLLSTATYTWFSLSKTPKVNDMSVYVNCNVGMQIAWEIPTEEESWGLHLDHSERFPENTILKPATYSDENDAFYAVQFGFDGRKQSISNLLTDEENANRSDDDAYYITFSFYAHTDEDVKVSLKDAFENSGTYLLGKPIWNEEEILHNDGGRGAASAMRIGFKITKYDTDGTLSDISDLIIYEPNCNFHNDYTLGYYQTPGMDGTETLVPTDRLIRQTATMWFETDPVQKEYVLYKYGEFLDEPHLFDLDRDCTAKIDVYIWLEGQDVDCTNEIGYEAKIFSNIQLYAERRVNTGLEEEIK
ncbi:MAG: hypothetical protein J6C89_01270 [Clostridia bacterium]|nr:hypothetical protein [Clostridia bacterium]